MSYFINPDGTISFVEDRYDSAGNIAGFNPSSNSDNFIDSKNDNNKTYARRTVTVRTAKKETETHQNTPKTDWMCFRGKTYTIRGINDIVKLFEQFIDNDIEIEEEDVEEMERFLSRKKRRIALWEQFILYRRQRKYENKET